MGFGKWHRQQKISPNATELRGKRWETEWIIPAAIENNKTSAVNQRLRARAFRRRRKEQEKLAFDLRWARNA
jgi:hypothetical protein